MIFIGFSSSLLKGISAHKVKNKATVSVCQENGKYEELANDKGRNIGLVVVCCGKLKIISLIVKLLGGSDLQLILNRLYNRFVSCCIRPVIFWKKLVPLYKLLVATVERLFMR